MAALAHNLLKMVRQLNHRVGPPDLAVATPAETTEPQNTSVDARQNSLSFPQYLLSQTRLGEGLQISDLSSPTALLTTFSTLPYLTSAPYTGPSTIGSQRDEMPNIIA